MQICLLRALIFNKAIIDINTSMIRCTCARNIYLLFFYTRLRSLNLFKGVKFEILSWNIWTHLVNEN